jgi:hypothetical protein
MQAPNEPPCVLLNGLDQAKLVITPARLSPTAVMEPLCDRHIGASR